jgi:23S rRNA pseudouridine955/2504/2580 synthase
VSEVETITVEAADDGQRLDRWVRQRFPALGFGRVQRLMRTGQIRVDGKRARGDTRLAAGQRVRIPPLGAPPAGERRPPPLAEADAEALRAAVLYRDDDVIAIDKPAGLPVQGGTRTERHLDGMLDALRFGARERPRLVHRLDRDTSGVLLLARHAMAARWLTAAFRSRDTRKLYWACVAGRPKEDSGRVDLALSKLPGRAGERVVADPDDGKRAVTAYEVIDSAGSTASWLALRPLTGRTHQLRAHCAALGTPILGDGKYGGKAAFLPGGGVDKRLHLHARSITVTRPDGRVLTVTAPLPPHMAATWRFFGFDAAEDRV